MKHSEMHSLRNASGSIAGALLPRLLVIVTAIALLPSSLLAATNTVSAPAGFVRLTIDPQTNVFAAMPFVAADPAISGVLSNQLTGAASENSADRVQKWNVSVQQYTNAYKYSDGVWYSDFTGFAPSDMRLKPGEGFFIQNRQSETQTVFLCGMVVLGNASTQTMASGFTFFGYPFSTSRKLNDTGLAAGAQAASDYTNADQVATWDSIQSQYSIFGLKEGDSMWHSIADWDGSATDERLLLGHGQWFKRVPGSPFDWTESRPYQQLFPTDGNPPVITGLRPNAGQDQVTLSIDATGIGTVEIYYKDLDATNEFTSTGWQIAATNITGGGTIEWTDDGSNGRGAVNTVYARYYLVGNSDIDTDGEGQPDSRETFVNGTDPLNAPVSAATIGINMANSTNEVDGGLLPASSFGYFSKEQANWNNIDSSGNLLNTTVVDANGSAVSGLTVAFSGIQWVLPDIYGNGGKHGYTNGVESLAGSPGYIGFGGADSDANPPYISVTVSNIPFASYNVAVFAGWYENAVQWYLVEGTVSGPQSFQDACVGNWFNCAIVGNAFTFNGGAGHGIYAIQIIPTGSAPSGISAPAVNNAGGATNITSSSAYLCGNLTSTGGAPSSVSIYWGPTDGGTDKSAWSNSIEMGALDIGPFSSQVTGLVADATYCYRTYATNSAGENWAGFTTNFIACAQSQAQEPGIGINMANGTTEAGGAVLSTSMFGYPGGEQAHWNNVDSSGSFLNDPVVDANGNTITGLTVAFSGIQWVLPDIYGNGGRHGHTNGVESLAGSPGYIGFGGSDSDGNPPNIGMTISGIPYSSYSVVVLAGWYENAVQWYLVDGAVAGPQSFQDGWVGNWFNCAISNSTFTLSGGAGHGIYAVQIVHPGSSVPVVDNAGGATNATASSASLCGNLVWTGGAATGVRIYWGASDCGTNASTWDNVIDLGGLAVGSFSSQIADLAAGSTYYYRSCATNSAGAGWAPGTSSFTTYPCWPLTPAVDNAGGATTITTNSAYLCGNLTWTGASPASVSIYWGASDGGTAKSAWSNVLNMGVLDVGAFSCQATDLAAGKAYYYRTYVTNAYGDGWATASSSFKTVRVASTRAPGILVRMDFGTASHPEYRVEDGTVESVAAAADPVFGTSGWDNWNFCTNTSGNYLGLTNTADGALATAVDLTFNGTFNTGSGGNGSDGINLRRDYIGAPGTDVTFVVSNLMPNTETRLFFYAVAFCNAPYRVQIGTNETVLVTAGTATNGEEVIGMTDGSGVLTGTLTRALDINPNATELEIAGLQIYQPDSMLWIKNAAPVGISDTTVSMNGYLAATGGAPAQVRLCWGTNDCGTGEWPNAEDLGVMAVGALSQQVSGLSYTNTFYYYRYYASNSVCGAAWASPSISFGGTGDSDGDGMPDGWEMRYGLNPHINDASLDLDGDGLTNLQEYQLRTNPNAADTDGDGVNDYEEIAAHTQPLVADFDGTTNVVAVVNGADTNSAIGSWVPLGTELRSVSVRGSLTYAIAVPTGDVYRLEIDAVHCWGQLNTCAPQGITPIDGSWVKLYIDGEYVGKQEMKGADGIYKTLRFFTPYLTNGTHQVTLWWDNVFEPLGLQVRELRLASLGGPDADANGVKDWVQTRLAATCTVQAPSESVVSPVCAEGKGRYLSMMGLSVACVPSEALLKKTGPDTWYADVGLSESNSTEIAVSFENGAKTTVTNITWVPLNVIAANGASLEIRKGDSVMFTAFPQGATNGTVGIEVVGVTNFLTSIETPEIQTFTSAGMFVVNGSYEGETNAAGSVTVEVVEASFPKESLTQFWNRPRTWECPGISTNVVLAADDSVTLSRNGTDITLTMAEVDDEHWLVARLAGVGSILARTKLDGIWVRSTVLNKLKIVTVYEDGSQLWENTLVADHIPTNVYVELNIFVGGVTFEDLTTVKQVRAADLDAVGTYTYRMLRGASVETSDCHSTTVIDEDPALLGAALAGEGDISVSCNPPEYGETTITYNSTVYVGENDTKDIALTITTTTPVPSINFTFKVDAAFSGNLQVKDPTQGWQQSATLSKAMTPPASTATSWTLTLSVKGVAAIADATITIVGPGDTDCHKIKVTVLKVEIDRDGDGTWANEILGIKRPSPDNTAKFKATISPSSVHLPIHFSLESVSSKEGTNMNTGDTTDLDLTFEIQTDFVDPTGTKQTIEETTSAGGADNLATTKVTAHDYGPYGNIKAWVDLGGGKTCGSASIKVLKDTSPAGGNNIEDAWDTAFPAPSTGDASATDDHDADPAGDGKGGDLLTRYEEYRGFTAQGNYVTTDPKKKTVFLVDKTGYAITDGGGGVLSLVSKLGCQVVFVNDGEYDANRQINSKGGEKAQRAVIVEDSESAIGSWGTTDGHRPSTYTSCKIWKDLFTRKLELAKALPNNAADVPSLLYYEDSVHGSDPWQDSGRVKIEDEVLGYANSEFGENQTKQTTSIVQTPASSETIIIGSSSGGLAFRKYALVKNANDEVVEVGTWGSYESGTIQQVATGANEVQTDITSIGDPGGGGNFKYARLGTGVDEEWITYTGYVWVGSQAKLTGVARGKLGTTEKEHAAGQAISIPSQWFGCKRHALGTTAADISVGTDIHAVGVLFTVKRAQAGTAAAHAASTKFGVFANVDDAVRQIAAHETGHAVGVLLENSASPGDIMNTILRGRYLGGPDPALYNDYSTIPKEEFNAH